MQASDWTAEHSEALREGLARGRSYSEIAQAINARFGTAYTRSATLGRSRRMGLANPERSDEMPKAPIATLPPLHKPRQRARPELVRPRPIFERAEPIELRCVEINPRHLSLMELERGDCRYPYGGDEEGEAITFCGHPQRPGSSYCVPHFHLTSGPGTAAERAAGAVLLRLVEATDAGGRGDVSPLFAAHAPMRA